MCFSASASFAAGSVLTVIGVISLKKVQTRSQLAFAGIPLIFALQQISEGFLWLALSHPEYSQLKFYMCSFFLVVAQVVWPFWVPLSVFLIEKDLKIRKLHLLFLLVGALISCYLLYCLIVYPRDAQIEENHIAYRQFYPQDLRFYGGIMYLVATIFPLFFSKIRGMKILGLVIAVSYLVSIVFYKNYMLSVWCFLASLISVVIFFIIKNASPEKNKN